jgi:hypothetical protein
MQSIKYMTRLHQIERNANVGVTDVGYEKLTQNTVLANDPVSVFFSKSKCFFLNLGVFFICVNLCLIKIEIIFKIRIEYLPSAF